MAPDCPECSNGKHQNCTQMVLDDAGEPTIPCRCSVRSHETPGPSSEPVAAPYGGSRAPNWRGPG